MELVTITGNPIPNGLKAGSITTSDGVKLRYAICRQDTGHRGTVCYFPGRRGFIERDFEIVRDLTERGFAVAMLDWRGQGGSDRPLKNPNKGHISNFSKYDLDVEAFMRQVVLPDCPPPFFCMAHSLGGNIMLRNLRKNNWYEAAILAAPLLGFKESRIPKSLMKSLIGLLVGIGLGRVSFPGDFKNRQFEGNELSHDEKRYNLAKQMAETFPQLDIGAPTLAWIYAAWHSNAMLMDLKGENVLRCPTMIVSSGDDKVVSKIRQRKFASQVEGTPLVEVENAFHEITLERDDMREQFWAAFDIFIERFSPTDEA